MDKLPLSVCMIYKESDKPSLIRCLKHLPEGLEIILLRTVPDKSEFIDMLQEGRKDFGGIMNEYDWHYIEGNFSFSKARNICKSYATRDWILQLDADELLHYLPDDFAEIFTLPDNVGGVTCNVISHEYSTDEYPNGVVTAFMAARIYRNKSEFKYIYSAHEQIADSILKNGYKIRSSDIIIKHKGYLETDNNGMIQKFLRNIELISRDLSTEHKGDRFMLAYAKKTLDALHKLKAI